MTKNCRVFACENTSDLGEFIGEFCAPCDTAIRTGIVGPGTSFFHRDYADMRKFQTRFALADQELRAFNAPPIVSDERSVAPNLLKHITSEWVTEKNDMQMTVHHRMIEGVLCRWWGDGPTPDGVALIDRATSVFVPEPMEGHDKPCYYCGESCNGLTGNPSRWPIPLCHPDEPGVVKWHHVGCVSDRLHGRVPLEEGK